jgi:hypothetical protein
MKIHERESSVQNDGLGGLLGGNFKSRPKLNNQTEILQGRKKHVLIDWDLWDPILGTDYDAKVARKIGCRERAVELRRKELNIPPVKRPNVIDWKKWDCCLGVEPDEKVAVKIGCSVQTIGARRGKLGIKPFREIPEVDLELLDAHIGRATDKEVAGIVCCSINTVSRRRKKLGVPAYTKGANAQKAGGSPAERIDWRIGEKYLGRMTDNKLAMKLGCQSKTVAARRRKLGLEPFTKSKRLDWITIDGYLGKSPDEALAERFGCSAHIIKKRRRQLGIGAFERHTRSVKEKEKLHTIQSLAPLRSTYGAPMGEAK